MNEWYSITEKPLKEPCLIVYKNWYFNNELTVGCTDAFEVVYNDSVIDGGGRIHEIVFWMPYPELPKITE